jgi:hypothetical protein
VADPTKHLRHGVKVLLKFKLLELQTVDRVALLHWAQAAARVGRAARRQLS